MIFRAVVSLCLVLLSVGKCFAQASDYPNRLVTMVAPVAPGAGVDFLARTVAQELAAKWSQKVIVENRPGGGTMTGVASVAHAKPDGYTMLVMTSTTLVNGTMFKKLSFDPLQDLAPVALIGEIPFVLVVNPSLPVTNVRELLAYAKANPTALSYGTSGPGTAHHLSAEILQSMTGITMVHVPYTGSTPALRDVISGHIPLMFVDLGPALPQIKAGTVRALGIATQQRVAIAPDIPTIAKSGVPGFPGISAMSWQSVMVTGGTSKEIVLKLNKDVNEVLEGSEFKQQLLVQGMIPKPTISANDLQTFMSTEFGKWAEVVTKAGLAGTK